MTEQLRAEGAAVWFTAPRTAEVRTEPVFGPAGAEITVRATASLISAGTEMLAYRGQFPAGMDLGLETTKGSAEFPIKYAYQVVGEVVARGPRAPFELGETVFARHPHQDEFTLAGDRDLVRRLPDGIAVADAIFANLMSVALGGLHDCCVRPGDIVVVLGLGTVGTFIAALASLTADVIAVEPNPDRRANASALGRFTAVEPDELRAAVAQRSDGRGADLVFEATGNPAALRDAVDVCGQEGVIGVVSFYGTRPAELMLGDRFHYGRQKIVSSMTGMIGGGLQARWDRQRRFSVAARYTQTLGAHRLLSHEAALADAAAAYRLLDSGEPVSALAFNYRPDPLTAGVTHV